MANEPDRAEAAFAAGVTQRRKNLVVRCVIGVVGTLVFEPIVGVETAVAWTLLFITTQMFDAWVFEPITSGKVMTLPGWRKALGCLTMALSTTVYGAVSIPMWQQGGLAGGICAVLILAGGATSVVMSTAGSRLVLGMTLTPIFAYLAFTPMQMVALGADTNLVTAVTIACLAFAGFVFASHTVAQRLAEAEREARRLSEQRNTAFEAAASGKSAFIASVGHDLRTPLSAILTGATELGRQAHDATARSNAALILDAGQMMNRLLDDLLDHARIEAGRMEIEPVVFNLRDLLARACRFWQGQAAGKGVRLLVEGGARVPAWVEGDPVRVRQILNNLLSNAVKFTAEGEVRVRLNAWEADGGACALIVEVADTGAGMDEAQVSRLFRPFDQTQSGVSGRHGGSGLGLWISRELAQLMGGRLTARSVKGEGSAFTLALVLPTAEAPVLATAIPDVRTYAAGFTPLPTVTPVEAEPIEAEAPPAPAPPHAPADEEDEGRPLRVLVVDDHDINRRAVQLILQPLGCEITQAADGMAALAAAQAEAFDVIFMDVRMPELDGRETTRRLRATSGANQHVPVIAVTADTSEEDVAACAAAGMTWFVAKPLTPATLLGALEAVLNGQAALDTPETQAA